MRAGSEAASALPRSGSSRPRAASAVRRAPPRALSFLRDCPSRCDTGRRTCDAPLGLAVQVLEPAQLDAIVVRIAEVDRIRPPGFERDRALDLDAEGFEANLLLGNALARHRERE